MKIQRKLIVILAAFILSGFFSMSMVKAGEDAPAFHARIEYRMGYTVIGTFTDFTPDIVRIETLCSLDGENWQIGAGDWNLFNLGTDDEDKLKELENQPCLFPFEEPLKSYIAGEIDCFYLKLRITRESGLSSETEPAVISRGDLQPVPDGTQCRALFASAVAASEPDPNAPYRHRKYARYQLTIVADATAEEIAALLPDTLPVEVQLDRGPDFIAIGIVDCPVTWKTLSLPKLSAGESITIPNAAEEITVPGGTQLPTPLGTFVLEEALSLDLPPSTGEVRLVLNVSTESRAPAGVLKEDTDGLKAALRQTPTGASSIQAYVLTEAETEWTELSGLSLLEEMNAQPSTENSGYALVLRKDQEPYRSYLEAVKAGTAPTPFFIGLKFHGGIYDGRQLILAWPDIYDELPELPEIRGAQGNEDNAGAVSQDDSTESGQRPNLPQSPDSRQQEPGTDPAPNESENQQTAPARTREAALVSPEDRNVPSTRESSTEHLSENRDEDAGFKQRPDTVDTAGAAIHASSANQKTSRTPLLLAAAIAAAACCCGGTVVCTVKGRRLLYLTAAKLRMMLHKYF